MRFRLESDTDTIVFLGGGVGDSIGWTMTGIEGWHGSPEVRESPLELTMEDGDYFPNTLSQGARTVTIHSFIRAYSSIELEKQLNKLNGMIGKRLRLIGESGQGARECKCYISADPEPEVLAYGKTATLDVIVTSPDPYKYSQAVDIDLKNSQYIDNAGNVDMYPTLKITGAGKLEEITYSCSGKTLKWSGYSDSVELNLKEMTCSNGYFSAPTLVPIKPGGDTVDITANVGFRGKLTIKAAWR